MTSRSPMRKLALALAARAAGIAAAGLTGPAAAQSSGQRAVRAAVAAADAELLRRQAAKSFAIAATKVRTVMQEYRPQLRQARQNQDREQFEKVRKQARQAVEQKIAGTDGSPPASTSRSPRTRATTTSCARRCSA
ncbi:MAG: hypothetical protein U5L06_00555 [Rhodovibrio sp.]|nr:hypothetical protein [Rhodovibrio sp.]